MGVNIQKLKLDRGAEYSSTAFTRSMKDEGIEEEKGPSQLLTADSVSERYFRTLLGKMRSQLLQSGLPLHLWGELAIYCSLQINCSPTVALQHQSPLQSLESLIPGHLPPFDEERLKPLGCLCFAADRASKSKMAAVAKRFIFVGLEPGARAARLWDKQTGRVFVTGDVVYREDTFPALDPKLSPNVLHEWIFPTFTDECVDSPPSPRITHDASSSPTPPEESPNSTAVKTSAISPPPAFRPRTLIPLSDSIHAPRQTTVPPLTQRTSAQRSIPPITDYRMRSQSETSDSESNSPLSPLRLPPVTSSSNPIPPSPSSSSGASTESLPAQSISPPLDDDASTSVRGCTDFC